MSRKFLCSSFEKQKNTAIWRSYDVELLTVLCVLILPPGGARRIRSRTKAPVFGRIIGISTDIHKLQ